MTQLKIPNCLEIVLHLTVVRHKKGSSKPGSYTKSKLRRTRCVVPLLAATRYWMLCYTRQSLDFQVGKLEVKPVVAISPRDSDLS